MSNQRKIVVGLAITTAVLILVTAILILVAIWSEDQELADKLGDTAFLSGTMAFVTGFASGLFAIE